MEDDTKTQRNPKKKALANILLIVSTLLWGTSFIITKNLTQEVTRYCKRGVYPLCKGILVI